MKKISYVCLLLSLAASCQKTVYVPIEEAPQRPYEVVDQTYVHKYGFEVKPEEWEDRGEHGKKITTLSNGITASESFNFGQLDGESTFSFPYSSNVEKAFVYSKGKLISEEIRFMGGAPKKRVDYIDGDQKKVTLWYESGVPQAVEEYLGSALQKGEYYNLANQNESQVINGNGTRTNRGSSGELLSKDTLENGEMIERTSYYVNGTPQEMLPFRHNIVHGLRRTFFKEGEPKTVEEWQNGVQTGITIVYQNGEKYAEIPYKNGLRHGVEKRYLDGKKLFEEITWLDGHESAPSRTYKISH